MTPGDLFPATGHDPGGRRLLRLPPGTASSAVFGGPRDCYRYQLLRRWGPGPAVLFVMMNPSTAGTAFDDPSVAKCGRFARAWGCDALFVGNAFAYRATDQRRLAEVADPVGPENDHHLIGMAASARLVVVAYGTPQLPQLRARGPAVARLLAGVGIALHVLRLSPKGGIPMHPLYLPETLTPQPWSPAPLDQ